MKPYALLTLKQVAAALKVSEKTVRNYVADGKFPPPIRLFECPRWLEEDVSEFVNKKIKESRNGTEYER